MAKFPVSLLSCTEQLYSAAMAHLILHHLPSYNRHVTDLRLQQTLAVRFRPNRIATSVTCMANQRRVKMVAKQIRRELSEMLLTDKNLQYAVLPEAALGADRYLSSVTTISDVEVSADLQVVKVYVSIFGDERGREVAIAGLKSKAKYVRGQLGRRMKLRLTPEIRFIEDESLERGSRVISILDKIKSDSDKKVSENRGMKEESPDLLPEEDDSDGDDDDSDEGIIYVK